MKNLTQSEIIQVLNYNPDSGIFTWRHNSAIAGYLRPRGYIEILIGRTLYSAHRVAWLYMTGIWPDKSIDVDHIDMIRSNNSWKNLRLATRSQNKCNMKKHKDNTSGYKGVYFEKSSGKWKSQIMVNYKNKNLGRFATKEEAYAAYCAAAPVYHQEFARVQ